MENLSFGQVLLLILFILVPLINFVRQRLRRRVENQIPQQAQMTLARRQAQEAPARAEIPGGLRQNRLREAQESPFAAAPSRRSSYRRSFTENKRDVRRGIIMMTILGPCRTFDPKD
jgi:hypothetical protein